MKGPFLRSFVSAAAGGALFLAGCSDFSGAVQPGKPVSGPAPTKSELQTIRIVFATPSGLTAANADGSQRFPLAQGDFRDISVSPDGREIAFSRAGALYLIDIDGSNPRPLAALKGTSPAWSPDGTRIAYSGTDGAINIVDMASGRSTQVTQRIGLMTDKSPTWAPDGRRIAFVRGEEDFGETVHMLALDPASGSWDLVPAEALSLPSTPLWSSAGDRIAAADRRTISIRGPGASTATVTNQHSPSVIMALEDWSVDGKWILFRGGEPGETDHFFVIGMDGRLARVDFGDPWYAAAFVERFVQDEPPPRGLSSFPELQRPGQVYVAPLSLYDRYFSESHGGPLSSRYVLYDDGTISLQFLSNNFGFFEYPGRRAVEGGILKFYFFANWNWDASATLEAGRLSVSYNSDMMMSDFMDGVYTLVP